MWLEEEDLSLATLGHVGEFNRRNSLFSFLTLFLIQSAFCFFIARDDPRRTSAMRGDLAEGGGGLTGVAAAAGAAAASVDDDATRTDR